MGNREAIEFAINEGLTVEEDYAINMMSDKIPVRRDLDITPGTSQDCHADDRRVKASHAPTTEWIVCKAQPKAAIRSIRGTHGESHEDDPVEEAISGSDDTRIHGIEVVTQSNNNNKASKSLKSPCPSFKKTIASRKGLLCVDMDGLMGNMDIPGDEPNPIGKKTWKLPSWAQTVSNQSRKKNSLEYVKTQWENDIPVVNLSPDIAKFGLSRFERLLDWKVRK